MNQSDPSQNDGTAKVIVLLPRDDDPIREISSGDHPHTTLYYLGDGETDMEALSAVVERAAKLTGDDPDPFDKIAGEGTLGEHAAKVYYLDARFSDRIREAIGDDPLIQAEMEKQEQFPVWTPHMTIGYPEAPAKKVDEWPDGIVYDRLAIFHDGEITEFPLSFTDTPDDAEDMDDVIVASAAEEPDEELEAAVAELQDSEEEFEVPWHGILAPEGTPSSDGRMFTENALQVRDLPVPLRWTPQDNGAHNGAVTVGRIDRVFRKGNEVRAEGVFDTSSYAYEAVRMIANGMLRGVSVDVADIVAAETEDENISAFQSAKIGAATLVAIPAFSGAFVALGPWEEGGEEAESEEQFAVSDKSWDGSPSRFTDEEYHRSCLIHDHPDGEPSKSGCKLPIREPNGDINKNGVHAAASRINQVDAPEEEKSKAKSQLKSAYKQIGEDPPEDFSADAETFLRDKVTPRHMDGPGWITQPKPTKRITGYWVEGRGAAKIRWGQGGDFNRCRRQLVKYVRNPDWLAGLCANLHHRALGIWPGQHSLEENIIASASPSVTFTEDSDRTLPSEWFADPGLEGPTAVTVTDEGRVYGHLATFDVCHIAYADNCVTAPRSASNYAYFKTGEVSTTDGPVAVGQIVMGGPHANPRAQAQAAFVHYASTSSALADVNVGEDEHGIWVAGAVRDNLSAASLRSLRASSLSGDWRRVQTMNGAGLELVAALAVNNPGFPIPRASLAASGSKQLSLVAASPVPQDNTPERLDRARSVMRAHRAAELKQKIGF